MDNEPQDRKPPAHGPGRGPYPLHKVAAALARDRRTAWSPPSRTPALRRTGSRSSPPTMCPDLDEPIGGSGIRGFLTRFSLSLGDDLDEIEQARQELKFGHALVLVMVDGMTEQDRAHTVLREHGGHAMRYFGRWAITTYEGDAH